MRSTNTLRTDRVVSARRDRPGAVLRLAGAASLVLGLIASLSAAPVAAASDEIVVHLKTSGGVAHERTLRHVEDGNNYCNVPRRAGTLAMNGSTLTLHPIYNVVVNQAAMSARERVGEHAVGDAFVLAVFAGKEASTTTIGLLINGRRYTGFNDPVGKIAVQLASDKRSGSFRAVEISPSYTQPGPPVTIEGRWSCARIIS